MKFAHHLYCNFSEIRGRQNTTGRAQRKVNTETKLKQDDKNLGNFGARIFNAKKNKFKCLANWALDHFYNKGVKVKKEVDKWKFVSETRWKVVQGLARQRSLFQDSEFVFGFNQMLLAWAPPSSWERAQGV